MTNIPPPVFRFAPSPNGALHLGHARSALLNFDMARQMGGQFLLRIEDIDETRCTPQLERKMLKDLEWLGLEWEDTPRRQSEHFADYKSALAQLEVDGLLYPAFMSRKEIKLASAANGWPKDPDGGPIYPGAEREWTAQKRSANTYRQHKIRLNMAAAIAKLSTDTPLTWQELGQGPDGETGVLSAAPQNWGDVVLARSDTPTSYHLSVVVDDALSGVTHIVRGQDLFHATSVHRVLQSLLALPQPQYHHHELILDEEGRKLSKSDQSTSLSSLRKKGLSPADIRQMVLPDQ